MRHGRRDTKGALPCIGERPDFLVHETRVGKPRHPSSLVALKRPHLVL